MLLLLLHYAHISYDEYRAHCVLCRKLANQPQPAIERMRNELAASNESSETHSFLIDTADAILHSRRRGDALCTARIGCVYDVPEGYIGPRCRVCMNAAALLLRAPPDERRRALLRFCTTMNQAVSSFCSDIIEEGMDGFIYEVTFRNDSLRACRSEFFCRRERDDL